MITGSKLLLVVLVSGLLLAACNAAEARIQTWMAQAGMCWKLEVSLYRKVLKLRPFLQMRQWAGKLPAIYIQQSTPRMAVKSKLTIL